MNILFLYIEKLQKIFLIKIISKNIKILEQFFFVNLLNFIIDEVNANLIFDSYYTFLLTFVIIDLFLIIIIERNGQDHWKWNLVLNYLLRFSIDNDFNKGNPSV